MSQDRQSIYSTQRCAGIMRSVSEAHSLSTTQAPTSTTWLPPIPHLRRSSAPTQNIHVTPLRGAQITRSVNENGDQSERESSHEGSNP